MSREYDQIWAVDAERVKAFFRDNPGDVTIITMPEKQLGPMTLPQTRIIITGENAEPLYQKFCLHFMTAGG